MITREFKLYLNAGVGVAPVINANQFDQSEEWVFTLLQSDGTVYTPSTGAIIGLKTDGTTILNAGTVNEDGQVVITETEQMTAVPGSNIFEILIDGNTHGTANFVVFVERRPGDIDHPSESDISLFQEAIEAAGNVTQFQTDIANLQSNVDDLETGLAQEESTRSTQDAVLSGRIDTLTTAIGETGETVLFDGRTYGSNLWYAGQTITLSESYKNFDYLDFYVHLLGREEIHRFATDDPVLMLRSSNLIDTSTSSTSTMMYIYETIIRLESQEPYTTVTCYDPVRVDWNGTAASNAQRIYYTNDEDKYPQAMRVIKIVGVKLCATNPEVTDIRVGGDGVTYPTAGDAVRGQYSDLKNALRDVDDSVFELTPVQLSWEHGTIDLSGVNSASNTRVRTIGVRTIGMNETITAENGFKYVFRFYKADGTVAGYSNWLTGTNSVNDEAALVAGATKYRLVGAYSNDASTVSDEALAAVANAITVTCEVNKIDRLEDTLNETIEVTAPLNWKIGSIGANNGEDGVSTTRIRTFGYIKYVEDDVIKNSSSTIRFSLRIYSNDKSYLGYSPWYTTEKTLSSIIGECTFVNAGTVGFYRITASYTDDSTITDIPLLSSNIALIECKNLQEIYALQMRNSEISIHKSATGNCTIRAAKEQAYVDGTSPVIEWYLIEEPKTGKFYYSKDLENKQYMFTFPYETSEYSFGVLQNGDIIVCLDADSIALQNKSDANRVNPFVLLATENWSVLHEVDFGSNLKPCGWVMDVGFKVLADGTAIFCEYTRQTTYTANVWKISGDPTDATNWIVTKSFVVTSVDNSTGFKHCHMVSQDHYTGVCYMSTGDDNVGSMLFCSTDNGSTWTQLVSPDSDGQINEYGWITGSEKYCRALNFIYTEDYIYWASDTNNLSIHYLFRVGRDANGVFDFNSVVDLLQIPANSGASTYGIVWLPEYNAIFMLDRTDVDATSMDLRMVLLSDNSIVKVGELKAIQSDLPNGSRLGFRYRFATKYPRNGVINIGFGLRGNYFDNYINHNRGFGNTGTWKDGSGIYNINNLILRITPTPDAYALTVDTRYI